MKRNTCDLLSRSKSASEETLHSSHEEEDPLKGMEPYLVRRLSCRNIQLPPLAFRQLEQADLKSESENLQRPTSLPLKILPLIAITSADSSGHWVWERTQFFLALPKLATTALKKDGNDNPICKTEKETQKYRTDF
ncbi:3',5'-cyclic-AMP phosphodiesterase 4D-like [Dama dama]